MNNSNAWSYQSFDQPQRRAAVLGHSRHTSTTPRVHLVVVCVCVCVCLTRISYRAGGSGQAKGPGAFWAVEPLLPMPLSLRVYVGVFFTVRGGSVCLTRPPDFISKSRFRTAARILPQAAFLILLQTTSIKSIMLQHVAKFSKRT